MGLSGFVGGEAQDALETLLRQRMLEQEAEARRVNEAFMRDLSQRKLGEDVRQFDVTTRQREADLAATREDRDAARRDRNNAEGVQQMLLQRKIMDDEAAANAPKPTKFYPVTVPGPNGKPMKKLVPEDELQAGVQEYQAPEKPSTEGRQWVDRGGQVIYDVPRPGDAPHVKTDSGMTEGERQRAARAEAAQTFLGRLDDLRTKINTKMGPQQGLGGLRRRGMAAVGLDPDVSQYERERKAAGRALAVAIMGAQNLSDADAEAWARMLPDATTDEVTAKRLIQSVKTTLQQMTGRGDQQSGKPTQQDVQDGPKPAPSHTSAETLAPGASAFKVGEVRTKNGETRRWNGTGWELVVK